MSTVHPGVAALPGESLTENQRRPLIDGDGQRLLHRLEEHPQAPRYNHSCGDRLTADGLRAVRAFDAETASAVPFTAGQPPPWLAGFLAHACTQVPRYRAHGARPGTPLTDLPTVGRAELLADPYSFVPDDHPLDELVVFTTTGTSDGQVAYVASTPVATASYQVLLRAALRPHGLTLDGGAGTVAVAQVCWQRHTYTYASTSTFLGQAGVLKLNLNPAEWRSPDDVAAFLDDLAPEVYTGDPVAFTHLAALPLRTRPKALLSSASALLPGLRRRLEARFDAPVIDVYGMTEAGPVAASLPDGTGHVPLGPRLYVEILDRAGAPVPPGVRGEITLTGGFNTALPLLRYRTGDQAALEQRGSLPVLVGLEGRAPVELATADGRAVNTIDVTVALRELTAARYALHQREDLGLELSIDATDATPPDRYVDALAGVFGALPVRIVSWGPDEPARPTYSSALDLESPG